MKDIITGKCSIYNFGEILPATEEECKHLEVCAVWENAHIIERLMGKDWKKWFPDFKNNYQSLHKNVYMHKK